MSASASVDQRTKGQPNTVPNGVIKETIQDEEFDKYIHHNQQQQQQQQQQQPPQQQQQQQQPAANYNTGPMSSPGVSDPFVNYYPSMSFPYLNQGLGEGAWSNGGDATQVFSMGNYDYNGMFGGFGYPQFAWDYPANEYWSNTTQGRTDKREYDEYYQRMIPAEGYGAMNGEVDRTVGINSVDQGFKAMTLVSDKDGSVSDVIPGDSGVPVNAGGGHGHAPQKTSWAAIASQPARPQPQMRPRPPRPQMNTNKQNLDIGTWDNKNSANRQTSQQGRTWSAPRSRMTYNSGNQGNSNNSSSNSPSGSSTSNSAANPNHPVLEKLKSSNTYNPKEYNLNPKGARFFIIKSYSEDDIHRSIKYNIWCSTEHGNKRLDQAFRERESKGPIFLLFSVNGSGHFCGMAQMMSAVDYGKTSGVWAQDKWKGQVEVKWIYVKDVPNSQLRHIRLENNENKPVTNSRDTQEVPPEKGKQVLKIIHNYRHTTSIFDDFVHYEQRQNDEPSEDSPSNGKQERSSSSGSGGSNGRSSKKNAEKDGKASD